MKAATEASTGSSIHDYVIVFVAAKLKRSRSAFAAPPIVPLDSSQFILRRPETRQCIAAQFVAVFYGSTPPPAPHPEFLSNLSRSNINIFI
ncbi:MAG: hypothetical protein AUH11_17965 [Acidobacteria bacterium 13_2_20CM_57_17]|nr:MAG: hypothetical protein AUH11_17965 [Acidobacteria bacterium 13_2_20CM_57_17]